MIAPLSFVFSIHDPSFTSKLSIVNADCPYIAHAFVQTTKPPETRLVTK